jgi:hypothetical protein
MAMFMNEDNGSLVYRSFVSVNVGNAMRQASEQIIEALDDALGEGFDYHESNGEFYWDKSLQPMRTIILSVPVEYDHAPPNTYMLSIIPAEDVDTIKNVIQGALPAADLPAGTAAEGPAGAARRRKSRKSRKSKKTSRRRRSTRRY